MEPQSSRLVLRSEVCLFWQLLVVVVVVVVAIAIAITDTVVVNRFLACRRPSPGVC